MISVFRNFAKSKWAVGLFALLMLSFVFFGGSQTDVLASLGPQRVIDAGDRSMDDREFRAYVERVRASVQERAGRPVSFNDLVSEGLLTQVLDNRTRELGFLEWAHRAGIRPGEALIIKQIRTLPAFFNQVTGQFDQQIYQSALAAQNIPVEEFEQSLRDEAAVSHYAAALVAGMRAPRIYGAVLAGQALETRDGRWFNVTQAMAGQAPAPTDAQLTAFLTENADRLRQPEFRMASVVLFTPAAGAAPAVTEAQVRERFEFKKASLSQPEGRTFVTFTTADQQAAGRIATALRAGQDPADVARTNRVEPVEYDARPQSAVTDRAVGSAVFGLTAGQVSAPIQGQLGWTVAQLASIQPGQPATLESARAEITAELQEEAIRGSVFERVEQYEKARQDGADLNTAVRQVGARFVQLPPFTAEGQLPDGQPMQAPPQIVSTAYSLAKGGESDVVDAGQGQYFVVRLDDIRAAQMPTLAEVRAPLTAGWTQRENARRLNAKAEELAARVRGGEDIAAVARSAGAELTVRTAIQQNQETQQALGDGAFRGLFGQGRGQVFTGPTGPATIAVGRVDAIHAANPAQAAPLVEQIRPRLTQQMVQEMVEGASVAAAERVGASNDPVRARAALGITAETAPATPAGAPVGAPAPAAQ